MRERRGMFVCHYGFGFVAKKLEPSVPLWVLFLTVQFLDVLWAPFILLGVGGLRAAGERRVNDWKHE